MGNCNKNNKWKKKMIVKNADQEKEERKTKRQRRTEGKQEK